MLSIYAYISFIYILAGNKVHEIGLFDVLPECMYTPRKSNRIPLQTRESIIYNT